VDDDSHIRNLYVSAFEKEGFEVTEAVDGVDGLDKATKIIPDLIFTGIIMPRMDGFGLMEALKKNVATSPIPVIISSHLGREQDRLMAEKLGAKDFIVLGFQKPDEVSDKVRLMFAVRDYELRVIPNDRGTSKLAKDMQITEDLRCCKCGSELVLSMRLIDEKNKIFSSKFKCLQCGAPN
jgi:CheY-like chemotaxis protein